jgi:hypothetical protein
MKYHYLSAFARTRLIYFPRDGVCFQVNPAVRCTICGRPVTRMPGTSYSFGGGSSSKTAGVRHRYIGPDSVVLGTPSVGNGIVVFSSQSVCHKQCFDKEMEKAVAEEDT